jgi:hypothetical protein
MTMPPTDTDLGRLEELVAEVRRQRAELDTTLAEAIALAERLAARAPLETPTPVKRATRDSKGDVGFGGGT